MRLDVRYRTAFAYSERTSESQNELRACPTTDASQRLLDYRVSVEPNARVFSYIDAWGTRVDAFGIRRHHTSMAVTAEASVETRPRPLPTAAPRTEALRQGEFVDAHIEYLQRDRNTDWGPGVTEVAHGNSRWRDPTSSAPSSPSTASSAPTWSTAPAPPRWASRSRTS